MFDRFKKSKQDIDNAVEGVKATGNFVGKVKEVRTSTLDWMSENPEKVVLITMGLVALVLIGGEVRRSKTEVNVYLTLNDAMRIVRTKK